MADEPVVEDPAAALADAAPIEPVVEASDLDRLEGEVDQGYVERLKKEAISHRLKAKEYAEKFEPWKDALDGWDDDQAQAVRDLLAAAKAGDVDAITAILGLGGDAAAQATPEVPAAPEATAAYLTAADVERILAEREQKAAVEAQVAAINKETTDLGYELGSNDHTLLLKIAHEQNLDIAEAHQRVVAWKQSLVDQFVAEKSQGGTPPPAQGAPGSGEREIRTLDDSRAAAMARFNASQTA